MPLVLIALGGAAGATVRYLVDTWVADRVDGPFPWGTLLVNLTGSFVLGVLFVVVVERGVLPISMRLPFMVGLVGAYTTFSTLMLDTWRLLEAGAPHLAIGNLVGSVALGLVCVVAGLLVGRALV